MIRSENTCTRRRSENRHVHKYTGFHHFIENKATRAPFYMEITRVCKRSGITRRRQRHFKHPTGIYAKHELGTSRVEMIR